MPKPAENADQDKLVADLVRAHERQSATQEILKAISLHRDNEKPVFDKILECAIRLCGADSATILMANSQRNSLTLMATMGARRASNLGETHSITSGHTASDAVLTGQPAQIKDARETELYLQGDPIRVELVDEWGLRTSLAVPLLDGDIAIGCITVMRMNEVRPFTETEIALIEAFAAQAIIVIQNVRQFRDLQKRLEREKASREILGVISQSRDDEGPVFKTVLRNSRQLCGASTAALMLGRPQDERLVLAALDHSDAKVALDNEKRIAKVNATEMKMDPEVHISARAICNEEIVHIADLRETESYRSGEASFLIMVNEQNQRSMLSVPLIDSQGPLGAINLHRQEPGLFSDDEVALIQTFAAQAVIAINNVRQFKEVQVRLEREAASAEILQVISKSRSDNKPVFEAIVGNAARLCGARLVTMTLVNDARTHLSYITHWGTPLQVFEPGVTEWPIDGPTAMCEAAREGQIVHVADLVDSDAYRAGEKTRVQIVDEEGVRAMQAVPLLQGGQAIGVIGLHWSAPKTFNESEATLIRIFAEQAVIAIENVRQFRALEALNAELGDRVEEQVGEIERMGRLKRFLPAAVADTVVSSGSEAMLKSHRALLGVLFCDIRGFTAFCETAEPEETIEVLQTYHEEMGKLINIHGAGVDHRMGDGIMVLFNDPIPCDDPAGEALRLAIAMRAQMADLCKTWKRMGYRLGFGVGVSLGYATVGMVGFEGRFDYTASGTAINLASRLCDEAEDGEILLSPKASIAVEDDFQVESRGEIRLKGLREPLEVFRLSGSILV